MFSRFILIGCICLFIYPSFIVSQSSSTQDKLSSIKRKLKQNRAQLIPKIKEQKKARVSLNKIKRDVRFNEKKLVLG